VEVAPGLRTAALVFEHRHCRTWWVRACQEGLEAANAAAERLCGSVSALPCPACPVVVALMLCSSVLGRDLIRGTQRWEQLVRGDTELLDAAARCGALAPAAVPAPAPAARVNLARAPPRLAALFLGCVWHAANAAEAEVARDEGRWGAAGVLKHSHSELAAWLAAVAAAGEDEGEGEGGGEGEGALLEMAAAAAAAAAAGRPDSG
jgi:hypothetical protein